MNLDLFSVNVDLIFVAKEYDQWLYRSDFPQKDRNLHSPIHIRKGLRNLAIWDSQEWQETAHVKSYGVDTSPKCTKYIFPYENGSSLLIKWCLEKPWGGSQSKVNGWLFLRKKRESLTQTHIQKFEIIHFSDKKKIPGQKWFCPGQRTH